MATEKRLIDAIKIYDAVENWYRISSGIEHRCERDFLDLICSAETEDAVKVVHGRWRKLTTDGYDFFGKQTIVTLACNCSVCGLDGREETNYCPNCGAKMDGDGNG